MSLDIMRARYNNLLEECPRRYPELLAEVKGKIEREGKPAIKNSIATIKATIKDKVVAKKKVYALYLLKDLMETKNPAIVEYFCEKICDRLKKIALAASEKKEKLTKAEHCLDDFFEDNSAENRKNSATFYRLLMECWKRWDECFSQTFRKIRNAADKLRPFLPTQYNYYDSLNKPGSQMHLNKAANRSGEDDGLQKKAAELTNNATSIEILPNANFEDSEKVLEGMSKLIETKVVRVERLEDFLGFAAGISPDFSRRCEIAQSQGMNSPSLERSYVLNQSIKDLLEGKISLNAFRAQNGFGGPVEEENERRDNQLYTESMPVILEISNEDEGPARTDLNRISIVTQKHALNEIKDINDLDDFDEKSAVNQNASKSRVTADKKGTQIQDLGTGIKPDPKKNDPFGPNQPYLQVQPEGMARKSSLSWQGSEGMREFGGSGQKTAQVKDKQPYQPEMDHAFDGFDSDAFKHFDTQYYKVESSKDNREHEDFYMAGEPKGHRKSSGAGLGFLDFEDENQVKLRKRKSSVEIVFPKSVKSVESFKDFDHFENLRAAATPDERGRVVSHSESNFKADQKFESPQSVSIRSRASERSHSEIDGGQFELRKNSSQSRILSDSQQDPFAFADRALRESNRKKDSLRASQADPFKIAFGEPLKNAHSDPFKTNFGETLRSSTNDPFKQTFSDPYKDPFRESQKDPFKENFGDPFQEAARGSTGNYPKHSLDDSRRQWSDPSPTNKVENPDPYASKYLHESNRFSDQNWAAPSFDSEPQNTFEFAGGERQTQGQLDQLSSPRGDHTFGAPPANSKHANLRSTLAENSSPPITLDKAARTPQPDLLPFAKKINPVEDILTSPDHPSSSSSSADNSQIKIVKIYKNSNQHLSTPYKNPKANFDLERQDIFSSVEVPFSESPKRLSKNELQNTPNIISSMVSQVSKEPPMSPRAEMEYLVESKRYLIEGEVLYERLLDVKRKLAANAQQKSSKAYDSLTHAARYHQLKQNYIKLKTENEKRHEELADKIQRKAERALEKQRLQKALTLELAKLQNELKKTIG